MIQYKKEAIFYRMASFLYYSQLLFILGYQSICQVGHFLDTIFR